jgi:hypothetical protein
MKISSADRRLSAAAFFHSSNSLFVAHALCRAVAARHIPQSDSAGIWLPGGVQVGLGVSEVLAAFCTTLMLSPAPRSTRSSTVRHARAAPMPNKLDQNQGLGQYIT